MAAFGRISYSMPVKICRVSINLLWFFAFLHGGPSCGHMPRSPSSLPGLATPDYTGPATARGIAIFEVLKKRIGFFKNSGFLCPDTIPVLGGVLQGIFAVSGVYPEALE